MKTIEHKSILFVCMGNICRSPTAEAVFRTKAGEAGLNSLKIDSAGTTGYHAGEPPDKRAIKAGLKRGYNFDGILARKVVADDFEKFDHILAMDLNNANELLEACPERYQDKINLFMSFSDCSANEVPDPYYGGAKGFELVLDLIERASEGFIRSI